MLPESLRLQVTTVSSSSSLFLIFYYILLVYRTTYSRRCFNILLCSCIVRPRSHSWEFNEHPLLFLIIKMVGIQVQSENRNRSVTNISRQMKLNRRAIVIYRQRHTHQHKLLFLHLLLFALLCFVVIENKGASLR